MKKSIIKTPTEFIQWCTTLKDVFSLDTETTSLNYLDLKMIGFSICDGKQACYVVLSECNEGDYVTLSNEYKKELLSILDYYISESKMIVFHSAPFDLMVLQKEGIEV